MCSNTKWLLRPRFVLGLFVAYFVSQQLSLKLNYKNLDPTHRTTDTVENETKLQQAQTDFTTDQVQCPPVEEVIKCHRRTDSDSYPGGKKGLNTTHVPCSDCIEQSFGTRFFSISPPDTENSPNTHNNTHTSKPMFLNLMVPPDFGSTILLKTLSSSPAVSDMCKYAPELNRIPWMCEATGILQKEKVFRKVKRFQPGVTNWTRVYEIYFRPETNTLWTDPTKPILIDKAPCNLAKTKEMVQFYEETNRDYRMIVMWRHPCRRDWGSFKTPQIIRERYDVYLEEILTHVPPEKRFHINYDDLILRPSSVLPKLLEWLPTLESLHIGETVPQKKKKKRDSRALLGIHGGSLENYVQSDACKLSCEVESVYGRDLQLWQRFVDHT